MAIGRRIGGYSKRSWIVVLFIALAFVFGGGEAKSPFTEMLVELLFAGFAIAWLWMRRPDVADDPRETWLVALLAILVLAVPVLQLVPLPPSVWQSLPGREAQVASLSLVGGQDTWRPISEVPRRTLITLLAILPAVGTMLAVSRMDLHERRLVPATIALIAFLTVALGLAQLASPDGRLTLYSKIHAGWITGFQSNRNHTAEVLLAGLMSVAFMTKLFLSKGGIRLPRDLSPKTFKALAAGFALVLFAALVMTGSRSGLSLSLVLAAGATLLLLAPFGEAERFSYRALGIVLVCLALFALAAYFLIAPDNSSIGRVAARFTDLEDNREKVWADAAFAWRQYWPVGIGGGGFIAAMFPAERLEFLDPTYPNQAHNDFLELGIEGGLAAYIVLIAVLIVVITLAVRHWRSRVGGEVKAQIIFAGTVLILLTLHSVVDYPLRSMSLSCLAGAACGMLSRTSGEWDLRRSRRTKGSDALF